MPSDSPDWLHPGARVTWHYKPGDNHAGSIRVPAIVRKVTATRVTVEIAVNDDVRKLRVTSRSKLSPRIAPARELGEVE